MFNRLSVCLPLNVLCLWKHLSICLPRIGAIEGNRAPNGFEFIQQSIKLSSALFPTLQALQVSCTHPLKKHMCLDKAYDADWIKEALKDLYLIEPHIQGR